MIYYNQRVRVKFCPVRFLFVKEGACTAKLTARQRRLVEEYLIDLNATQAAIWAGYSAKTAYSIGERLLKHVEVKAGIDAGLERIKTDRVAIARKVEEYLTRVLRDSSAYEIVMVESYGGGCFVARRMKKSPDERERLRFAYA